MPISSDPKAPKIEFYEVKITDVSGLLEKYIKEAGGYRTDIGNKFGYILHEVNSAFGSIHGLIQSLKFKVEALETKARREVTTLDRHRLMLMLWRSGLVEPRKGFEAPSPEMEAFIDTIIEAGWLPPDTAERFPGESLKRSE